MGGGLCCGRHLSAYWEQKKRMAPGAEPPRIARIMDAVRVPPPAPPAALRVAVM